MADPRSTSTNRLGTDPKRQLTFKADGADIVYSATTPFGSAVAGRAVTQTGQADGVVRLAGAGDVVSGKLLHVEHDGYCAIQTSGVFDLPKGDGATVVGTAVVGDVRGAVRGYIRSVAASGAAYAEAAADETQNGRGRVINDADADAVEIEF